MTICPLWGFLPEIIVTVEDIRVVDGQHFVAANFDGQPLHDGAARILNHSPVYTGLKWAVNLSEKLLTSLIARR